MPDFKKIDKKTFYLYDYSNILVLRAKKIYSPYNIKTLGRIPSEDFHDNPDFVVFIDGIYIADRKKLGDVLFEQQLEWLSFYNSRGGQLSKGGIGQKQINGRFYMGDRINFVKSERIHVGPKVKTKTITEKVEVQQIPEIIAKNMNVSQLKELAVTWNVELPDNLLTLGDAEIIKSKIIELLKESGNLS